jgi:hypothetical protein
MHLGAKPFGAFNRKPSAMAHHDMARNGKAKPGAALMAGTRRVHAVKSFGQARDMVLRNTGAIIGNAEQGAGARGAILCDRRLQGDSYHPAVKPMIDRIFQDIADHLRHLIRIGGPRHQRCIQVQFRP